MCCVFKPKHLVIYEEQLMGIIFYITSNGPFIVKSASFCKYVYCDREMMVFTFRRV